MRPLLILAFAAALTASFNSGALAQTAKPENAKAQNKEEKQVKDPVCGMTISPQEAADKYVYKGKTYYFCSKEDKDTFTKNPGEYTKAEKK